MRGGHDDLTQRQPFIVERLSPHAHHHRIETFGSDAVITSLFFDRHFTTHLSYLATRLHDASCLLAQSPTLFGVRTVVRRRVKIQLLETCVKIDIDGDDFLAGFELQDSSLLGRTFENNDNLVHLVGDFGHQHPSLRQTVLQVAIDIYTESLAMLRNKVDTIMHRHRSLGDGWYLALCCHDQAEEREE